jgi:glutaminyl-peptide cyclotransferase
MEHAQLRAIRAGVGRTGSWLLVVSAALAAACVPEPMLGRLTPDRNTPPTGNPPPGLPAPFLMTGPGGPRGVEDLVAQVVRSIPHDPEAFTQGLVYHQGQVFESTGLEGASSLRRLDLESGNIAQKVPIPAPLFGEGLALVGNLLVQLTWKNGRALVWEANDLWPVREYRYAGEGWGLCHDGTRLVMSDGSDRLTFRDPETFTRIGEVAVVSGGQPVRNLNELECVGNLVYANVWGADHIARIDVQTGQVTAWIDASGLLSPEQREKAEVLNGIAHLPERGSFLLTGKYWPCMFEVQLVPRSAAPIR